MVNNDPVARGALIHFVDKCMEGDRAIIKADSGEYDAEEEDRIEKKFKFRTLIERKIYLLGKLFNNVYIEIVKDTDNNTKSLNVLDSMNIEAVTEPNGDPISYLSRVHNAKTGKPATWTKDEIVWIKFGDRSIGYAPTDLRALWENLVMKSYIHRYVSWLWKTGQYRLIYNFKNAADQDISDFLAYNRKHDNDYQTPMMVKGEMETKLLRDMKETSSLVELLKYLDGQTLILLRVPPIDAGIPDASGRSNSDAQSNNFSSHITSYKKVVEDYVNYELFPKINLGNTRLRYAPNDRFSEEQVLKNVQIMQSLMMSDEAIEEYMADRGMFFKTEKLFKELPLMSSTPNNPRGLDTAPSRTGKSPGAANKQQAKPTTRPDQLKK
jgi:hypothetical protein